MQWRGKNNYPARYCNGIVSFQGHFGNICLFIVIARRYDEAISNRLALLSITHNPFFIRNVSALMIILWMFISFFSQKRNEPKKKVAAGPCCYKVLCFSKTCGCRNIANAALGEVMLMQ